MSLIKINNVSRMFAGVEALKNVDITMEAGEIRTLAGENGSGKSTLIKIISGVVKPDSGTIEINDKVYHNATPIDMIQEGIQVIYQDFSVFPNLTAAENIALNFELSNKKKLVNWKKVYEIASDAISKINVNIDLTKRVEELSVADKQLIAISRALLNNAKLIIMDEPTTTLTRKEVHALFEIIRGLQKKGIAVLFVSHIIDELFSVCEKITILRNGERVYNGDLGDLDNNKLVYYMTGKTISRDYYTKEHDVNETLLRVENLNQKGGFRDISFDLKESEILGITGLLGSGRTSLAKALFGIKKADSGSIEIEGKPVRIDSVNSAIKNGIAYVPEDRLDEGLFLNQSIGSNIVISVIDRLLNRLKIVDKNSLKGIVDRSILDLNIQTPSAHLPVKSLSGGNQQRVVLAKWLATNPKIFVLNAPTVGIDVGSKAEIYEIIRDLAKKGAGIIIISDDLPEVLHNCNRILVMKKGTIVAEFMSTDVTEQQLQLKLSESESV